MFAPARLSVGGGATCPPVPPLPPPLHSSNSEILAWDIYSLGEIGPRPIFQPASQIEGLPTASSVYLCF